MSKLVQQARVKTNSTPGSVCTINVKAITFDELWANYVTGDPYRDPKSGNVPKGYENQCAIRMSATLHKVGVEMKSYRGPDKILLDGMPTSVRAQELGKWLSMQPFCGLPRKPENVTGKDWEAKIKGRTGIVMFDSYWTRSGESTENASGGHIDLWTGTRLTISGGFDFFATVGRMVGRESFRPGREMGWSDLANSKTILFWEVK